MMDNEGIHVDHSIKRPGAFLRLQGLVISGSGALISMLCRGGLGSYCDEVRI